MSVKLISKLLFIPVLLLATIAVAQTGEQLSAPPPGTEPNSLTESGIDNGDHTIVVDVWSSAAHPPAKPQQADPTRLSPGFAATALTAATRIQFTQRRITNSIKMGFPLGGGFWIQTDLDAIDDSLRMAALTATNEADRQALQQLQNQTNRLREWCDWLIDQNRNLRLANYFISPATLDNDERYQNTVACNNFLMSMLASGRLQQEDRFCR
jgi:hypothetical protein